LDEKEDEIKESGRDGELVYAGENVSLGYAEEKADLVKKDENKGILHTGDIARRDEDGYFYITGRMKRFVKIFGNRCNLDAMESLLKDIVPDCACIGVDDLITVFVTKDGLSEIIRTYLVQKTGLNNRAFNVRLVDRIPRSESGKVLYAELNKLLD
jgi:acyl-coenzyme A synthetase/AMP-(fatty) acid ligase